MVLFVGLQQNVASYLLINVVALLTSKGFVPFAIISFLRYSTKLQTKLKTSKKQLHAQKLDMLQMVPIKYAGTDLINSFTHHIDRVLFRQTSLRATFLLVSYQYCK